MPLQKQVGHFGNDTARLTGELERSVNDGIDQAAAAPSVSGVRNTVDAGDVVQAVPGSHYLVTARTPSLATFDLPDPDLHLGKHISISGDKPTNNGAPTVQFTIRPGGAWKLRGSDASLTLAGQNQTVDLVAMPGDWVLAARYERAP